MKSLQFLRCLAGAAWLAIASGAGAQVSVYDGASRIVSIPSVSVGAATFTNVTLRDGGNFVFTLQGATEQKPAGPGVASYDTTTGVLTMPAVKVGTDTYLDVKLLNTGNYVFTLQAATLLPQATVDEVKAMLAAFDALWATAVPANSAIAATYTDACYRSNGRNLAWLNAEFDKDPAVTAAREAQRVGSRRSNIQVLALRNRSNPDGSSRREIDVQYDVEYKDGSVALASSDTLISGSSAGTPGCATAQTGTGLRWFGNQRLVGFSMQARINREERYSISTGAPLSPAVRYRREIRVNVTDPLANAKYVVISGPGPAATVNGASVPWSWKMVSPFLMRSAPELAGKAGNYVNFEDDDSFRRCGIAGTGTPVASASDCLTYGAPGDNWGIGPTATPDAAADQSFANQGWVTGGVYKLEVYNDDGWKTVNGHAGKTPIATYYEVLKVLPQTFVSMAGTGANPTSNDRFPKLDFGALGVSGVRNNALSATPSPISVSWSPLQAQAQATAVGGPFRLLQTWEYFQGAKTGNASGVTWPMLRSLGRNYTAADATSLSSWPVLPQPAEMSSRSYFEYNLFYGDRGNGFIQSRVQFE